MVVNPDVTGCHRQQECTKAAETVTGPHCMLVRRRSCCIYLTFKIIHRSIKDDGLESWSTPNRWTSPQGCNNGLDRGSTANFSCVLLQMLHSHWDGFEDWRGVGMANNQQLWPDLVVWQEGQPSLCWSWGVGGEGKVGLALFRGLPGSYDLSHHLLLNVLEVVVPQKSVDEGSGHCIGFDCMLKNLIVHSGPNMAKYPKTLLKCV